MPAAFTRSLRSIQADRGRARLALAVGAAVLAAWGGWFFAVPVGIVEVAEGARIEVGQNAHPVAAAVEGLVVESRLELGREVQRGEVLVALDARALELTLLEKRALLAGIERKLGPLARELAEVERALAAEDGLSRARVAEARARRAEAEAGERFASSELRRQQLLRADGLARAVDEDRARADLDVKRAEIDAARAGEARVAAEVEGRVADLRARAARLARERAELLGAQVTEEAAAATLAHAVELRRVRAPVAGRLGEVAPLSPGAVLKSGEKVASVVPAGDLLIVAHLSPAVVFGRVRPGQPARMRLEGFPWAQYGEVKAKVARVAAEPREGKARVELAVTDAAGLPLTHGLPGAVEIEIERATPAALVLRAAGGVLGGGRGGGE